MIWNFDGSLKYFSSFFTLVYENFYKKYILYTKYIIYDI